MHEPDKHLEALHDVAHGLRRLEETVYRQSRNEDVMERLHHDVDTPDNDQYFTPGNAFRIKTILAQSNGSYGQINLMVGTTSYPIVLDGFSVPGLIVFPFPVIVQGGQRVSLDGGSGGIVLDWYIIGRYVDPPRRIG